MAGISDLIGNVKGFVKDARENWFAPKQYEGGDDPEYMKLFNFFWEKGYDQQQIDAIIRGEVDPTQIVPSRQKMDAEGNIYIDQEPFRGAKGGIVGYEGGGYILFKGSLNPKSPMMATEDKLKELSSIGYK